MAEALGVALATFARYERGERLPDAEVLIELRRKFAVDLNWLLDGQGARADGRPFITSLAADAISAEFVLVPRYNVKAEGGSGNEVFDEEVVSQIAFRRDWLEAEGLLGHPLAACDSEGDSMWPTIPNGYMILVDARFKSFERPGIYVMQAFGRLVVKRLDMDLVTGDLSIISDNRDKYPPRVVPPDLQNELHIIGRAVWWAPGHADL